MPLAPSSRAPRHGTGRRSRRALDRRWWATFAVLFAMAAMWSLATPLMASPDEPAHTVKAAAVVRGQFVGTPEPPVRGLTNPDEIVRVPAVFADTNLLPGCFAFKPTVPASCSPRLGHQAAVVRIPTPAGRYEPLYYLVVGLPSLVFRSGLGVHLMRLLGALACCALLASAFESARARRNPLRPVAVAVALSPMTIFLAATVNPSGLEIAAAICLWMSGLALVADDVGAVTGRLVARTGLSAAVLVQVRSLSLLWTALIGVALLALAEHGRIAALARRRDVQVWAAVFGACVVFALSWLLAFDPLAQIPTPPAQHLTTATIVETSIGKFDLLVREMIGVLGWTDTFPPTLTFYGWLALVGALAALGVARARRRQWLVLGALSALTVVIPVALESSQAAKVGFIWQGRYTLPLAVGIPLLAAALVPDDLAARLGSRTVRLLAGTVVVAQGAMFFAALRRYAVGTQGRIDFFAGSWRPPGGAVLVTAVFVLALLAYGVVVAAGGSAEPAAARVRD
ncbi:MAG: DUF2142 domain-containing protein [Acidimicrobiales bacterium]